MSGVDQMHHRIRIDGTHDNRIHTLGDKGLDRRNLGGGVRPCVTYRKLDPQLAGPIFHSFNQGYEIGIRQVHNGITEP